MVFLVPHDYFCNSTSFGPKIIPKGQFKVPKKVKEFCSFATFYEKPNFFRESHVVLRDGQNNYFQVNKVVEGFMLYTYSFRKKVGFSREKTTNCGNNMWWVIKASSNGSFYV